MNSLHGYGVPVVVRDRESLSHGEGEQLTSYRTPMKGAECLMQNSEIVLYNLSKQATNENYVFNKIYRNLYNKDFYLRAYANIYANKGSATKGIDNSTADGFGDELIESIIEEIKTESYQPKPVRRTYIPKKDGKKRPLGIPTFKDRIIQEIVRMILEAIYEPNFSNNSHGFRPKRSCHTALSQIKNTFAGTKWFVEGDIKSYFDNINHQVVIRILRERIKDEKMIRLIWKFLRAGFIEDWRYNKTFSGTPQGGIISPLLANIYLDKFDKWVENILIPEMNKGTARTRKRNPEYRALEFQLSRVKKQINATDDKELRTELINKYSEMRKTMLSMPYYEGMNEGYVSIKYVRYADDFLISVHGSKEDSLTVKAKIKEYLMDELKIELSEEKTLITYGGNGANFLNYQISIRNEETTKKVNGLAKRVRRGAVQLLMPEGTIEKTIIKHRMVQDLNAKEWKTLHRPGLLGLSALEIVETYNAELRGIYNYYALAENVAVKMGQLHYIMEYSCLKTLAGKYKTSISKIKNKYKQGKNWGIPYETKDGERIAFFYNKGYAKKNTSTDTQVDNFHNPYVYRASGELEQRLKANSCEMCGNSGDNFKYEVHHVNKLKNLKGKALWEIHMLARQRKTLIVCQKCHQDIHAGRL